MDGNRGKYERRIFVKPNIQKCLVSSRLEWAGYIISK